MNHPALSHLFMNERIRELQRTASQARLANQALAAARMLGTTEIVIRDARPSDADAVARLASLDGRPTPVGRVIVASVCGYLRAAVGANGHAVSDPFVHTEELVALLRMRASQIGAR